MIIPQWGSASLIEIVWTVLAIFGMGFSLSGLRDAILDRREVADDLEKSGITGDSILQVIANSQVRSERTLFFMQFVFALVGVMALFIPSPQQEATLVRTILAFILILGEGSAAWNALQNKLDRRKVVGWKNRVIPEVKSE